MCQSPERCSSTFHSARRHLMILTQSSRPRFVSSSGNVAVPQHHHKPEHLQLHCVAVAKSGNSGEANEMFPQETGRCARPQHPCARVSKEASSGVKVFLSKSPHHERDALWIKGVPAGKRGTQKFSMSCATPETPVIGLPHVDVSSSWMRGVNNVDEPHRSLR